MGKTELLLYGLFVVGILVFNYLMQQAAKRAREQQEQEQAQQQQATPSPPEDEPLEDIWGHRRQANLPATAAPVEPPRRVEPVATSPAIALRRIAPRALFRSKQDLRHAIVVMTVLGPCRALEPHDRR
jgi:hypothetical protein